jgi:hypothetical protein
MRVWDELDLRLLMMLQKNSLALLHSWEPQRGGCGHSWRKIHWVSVLSSRQKPHQYRPWLAQPAGSTTAAVSRLPCCSVHKVLLCLVPLPPMLQDPLCTPQSLCTHTHTHTQSGWPARCLLQASREAHALTYNIRAAFPSSGPVEPGNTSW